MASIQRLRASASRLGNLQSTSQQQVTNDGGDIEIDPADAQEMYVPSYQQDQVYDDSPNGAPYITFGIGYPIGDWLDNDFDWGNNDLVVWDQGSGRPANWWHESRGQRDMHNTRAWRPGNRTLTAVANRGDRGWARNAPSPAAARTESAFTGGAERSRPVSTQNERANAVSRAATANERASTVSRAATAPAQHYAAARQPEANGALIGIQSRQATRTYSDRGQQSMRAIAHSSPVSRPAAAPRAAMSFAHAGGGGGARPGGGGGARAGGGGGHAGGGRK